MNKKQKRNLEVISHLDDEIVEKASQERSNLLLALKRRIKKMWLIRGGAMAASLALIATTVLLVVLLAKEVPVYTGMTVSNTAPTTVASVTLPDYLDPGNGNGNGNAYGNKHLNGDHTDADKTIGDKPFENPIDDAVGAFQVQSAEPRYYAKPNEDVYITVHIDNPDDFVILSFTLNGKMYSSYMFEEGSDLENLILKVNVGDVEGVVSYTIDAIKYVDGTKIKDVKIGGERTVEIGVYTEKQPAAAFGDLLVGFNSISFAVDVSDTKNLFETLTGSVEAVLYDGENIVARKEITATGKTEVTFDGLTTGALYQCAIIATYDALDGEGITRHILSTHAAYTKSIVLFDEVEIGTTSVSFGFLWDEAFANKTVTGLALYQNDTKIRDIEVSATTVGDLVPGATYTLVATYQNGAAEEQIRITFTTEELFVTVNQYLEALDGTYTLAETVTEKVTEGTVYAPALSSYEGFNTPTVAPVTMTDTSHTFDCYFERTAYEITFHYNSAQGIANESIKFGKPLATPVREGFAFGGWYLDADLTTPAGDTVPAESISVFAKWLVETSPADFSYEINEGKVTLTGFESLNLKNLVIPAYVGGYPVTNIAWNGQWLFDAGYADKIVSVTIPDTVTTIGDVAFRRWNLASVTIPSSVTTVGQSVFANCTALTSVTILNTVIGWGEFMGCTNLASIEISDSVTTIGANAFAECINLASITIPNGITTIDDYLFHGCRSLGSIEIPDSVTTIGRHAFNGCTSLTSIEIPGGVTTIYYYAFNGCTSLTSIEIPDSVTTIGERAFQHCTSLSSIEIPDSVTEIGPMAFADSGVIQSEGGVAYVGKWVVGCDYDVTNVNLRADTVGIADSAFSDCMRLTSITIPDSVTKIGGGAFSRCGGIQSEGGVSYVGKWVVKCDYDVTNVILRADTVGIANHAFDHRTYLASITIPDSVTTVGREAFGWCTALSSVTFENTEGWQVNGNAIAPTDLEDTSLVATYLKDTYLTSVWSRW